MTSHSDLMRLIIAIETLITKELILKEVICQEGAKTGQKRNAHFVSEA